MHSPQPLQFSFRQILIQFRCAEWPTSHDNHLEFGSSFRKIWIFFRTAIIDFVAAVHFDIAYIVITLTNAIHDKCIVWPLAGILRLLNNSIILFLRGAIEISLKIEHKIQKHPQMPSKNITKARAPSNIIIGVESAPMPDLDSCSSGSLLDPIAK